MLFWKLVVPKQQIHGFFGCRFFCLTTDQTLCKADLNTICQFDVFQPWLMVHKKNAVFSGQFKATGSSSSPVTTSKEAPLSMAGGVNDNERNQGEKVFDAFISSSDKKHIQKTSKTPPPPLPAKKQKLIKNAKPLKGFSSGAYFLPSIILLRNPNCICV